MFVLSRNAQEDGIECNEEPYDAETVPETHKEHCADHFGEDLRA